MRILLIALIGALSGCLYAQQESTILDEQKMQGTEDADSLGNNLPPIFEEVRRPVYRQVPVYEKVPVPRQVPVFQEVIKVFRDEVRDVPVKIKVPVPVDVQVPVKIFRSVRGAPVRGLPGGPPPAGQHGLLPNAQDGGGQGPNFGGMQHGPGRGQMQQFGGQQGGPQGQQMPQGNQ